MSGWKPYSKVNINDYYNKTGHKFDFTNALSSSSLTVDLCMDTKKVEYGLYGHWKIAF